MHPTENNSKPAFDTVLPATTAKPAVIPVSGTASHQTDSDNRATILIADDDRDLLQLVRMRLEAEGYRVAISLNAEDISRIAVDKHADVILLDISMDGISGEDICKQLKHHKRTSSIPVVLFSANDDIDEAARACGADDYMPKPFSMDAMKEKLSRFLATSSGTAPA